MSSDTPIGRLRGLALAAGAAELADNAAALEDRIREQRFNVACVGQFKRGKSTLLNALVGQPLLPTGVVPVTSAPTVLRYGQLGCRVRLRDGWTVVPPQAIGEFVTEQRNPANAKGVLAVEVLLPAEILEDGLCLVDTPGLGSVSDANTAATREFVPHIDAALVVLGADPPISGEELRLVEMIAAETDTLVFILNKIDRVTAAEREEAGSFLRAVLRDRLGLTVEPLYQVSAVGGGGGPDWEALRRRLGTLAAAGREGMVRAAVSRGVARIAGALRGRLREQLAALSRPLKEYERRTEELWRLGRSSERLLFELGPLLAAEDSRLERQFRARADEFLAEAQPAGLARLSAAWADGRLEHASREEVLEQVNGIARALVLPWLRRAEADAEGAYNHVVQRFKQLGDEHLARLGEATGLPADAIPPLPALPEGFRLSRRFAFSDRASYHYPRSPLPLLVDRLLPPRSRRRRRQRIAERYLGDLLTVNASRVVGDLAERVRESRRNVEAEMRETLRRAGEVAGGALEWARVVRARGVDEIGKETAGVQALLAEVERLLEPTRERAA